MFSVQANPKVYLLFTFCFHFFKYSPTPATIVTNPTGYGISDEASASILRKRPRSPQNASTSLQSPEAKRKSKELEASKMVLSPGHVEMVSQPTNVIYYDIRSGQYYFQ